MSTKYTLSTVVQLNSWLYKNDFCYGIFSVVTISDVGNPSRQRGKYILCVSFTKCKMEIKIVRYLPILLEGGPLPPAVFLRWDEFSVTETQIHLRSPRWLPRIWWKGGQNSGPKFPRLYGPVVPCHALGPVGGFGPWCKSAIDLGS